VKPLDLATRLVRWQQQHGRNDLPWQATRDPYRVWLSEIMLQQTQVVTVRDYYARFLQRFPDVQALADHLNRTVSTRPWEERQRVVASERYQWVLAAAIGMLFAGGILGTRRTGPTAPRPRSEVRGPTSRDEGDR